MEIKFKLLSLNVYGEGYHYVDDNLTFIPENIAKTLEEFLDTNIQNLIKIGNFSMNDVDSYYYGGVGCGDNLQGKL